MAKKVKLKECYGCKKIVDQSEMENLYLEIGGPDSGCSEFAPPEHHPVWVCKGCLKEQEEHEELEDQMDPAGGHGLESHK